MKKLALKKLNVFTPILKDQSIASEEFDVDNFLHFPSLPHILQNYTNKFVR